MKGTAKMIKTRIVVGVLALAVVAAIVIACTKEEKTMVDQSSNQMTTVSKEDDMSAYLKHFKEKMQSAEKGNETLSLEDARWHLEAVLNYTYGDAEWPFSAIHCDTFYYELPTMGGVVNLVQLNEAFNSFSNNVEKVYEECTLPEKRILAIQTRFNTDSKDGDVSAQIIINTCGIMPVYPRFDYTDYWHDYYDEDWHYGYGKCGPYSGQCEGSGAPHELTNKANLRIPEYGCLQGYRKYVTDVSPVEIHAIDDVFLRDSNSPCGYKIYYNSNDPYDPSHNPSHCIPPEDMNYYLDKFIEIMMYFKPNGKEPISALYLYDILTSIPGAVLFRLDIDYAIIHCEYVGLDE
jgi:hypothetical protein